MVGTKDVLQETTNSSSCFSSSLFHRKETREQSSTTSLGKAVMLEQENLDKNRSGRRGSVSKSKRKKERYTCCVSPQMTVREDGDENGSGTQYTSEVHFWSSGTYLAATNRVGDDGVIVCSPETRTKARQNSNLSTNRKMYWPSPSDPCGVVHCDEVSLQSWMQHVNKSPLLALRKAQKNQSERVNKERFMPAGPHVVIKDLSDWEHYKCQELLCIMDGGWEGTLDRRGSFEKEQVMGRRSGGVLHQSQAPVVTPLPTSCSAEGDGWELEEGENSYLCRIKNENIASTSRRAPPSALPAAAESTRTALRVLEERRQNLIFTPLPPAVSRKLAESAISSPARLTWPKAEPDQFLQVFPGKFSPTTDSTLPLFLNDENLSSPKQNKKLNGCRKKGYPRERVRRSQKHQLLCKLDQFQKKLDLASKQVHVELDIDDL